MVALSDEEFHLVGKTRIAWARNSNTEVVITRPNGLNFELCIADSEQDLSTLVIWGWTGKTPSHEDWADTRQLAVETRLCNDVLVVLIMMNFPLKFCSPSERCVFYKDNEGYLRLEGGSQNLVVPPGWVGRYQ